MMYQNLCFGIMTREGTIHEYLVCFFIIFSSVTVRQLKKNYVHCGKCSLVFTSQNDFARHLRKGGSQLGTEIREEKVESQICLHQIDLPPSTVSVPATNDVGIQTKETLALLLEPMSPISSACISINMREPMDQEINLEQDSIFPISDVESRNFG